MNNAVNYEEIKKAFNLVPLTEEEKERRGILGRICGPCASISIPTRNGRKYSESLWERVFNNDDLTKEMFDNGGIPMELDHPTDREETCSEKIAAMFPEPPKRDKDGHLICYVDLIDTPMGRIAYQLAKYGFNLGISSRGSGDIIEGYDGGEEVDPETYEFKTFDLVLLPAVKDARLKMVTESIDKKDFKKAINESLNKSTEEEKKIMREALSKLHIDYSSEERDNINNADDVGLDSVKELQEALKANKSLREKIAELQEKLSVCYAKEANKEEVVDKKTAIELSEAKKRNDCLKERIDSMKQKMQSLNEDLEKSNSERDEAKKKYESMKKANDVLIQKDKEKRAKINESMSERENKITSLSKSNISLTESVSRLKESLEQKTKEYDDKIATLNENISTLERDAEKQKKEYEEKINESANSVSKYKSIAKLAVEKYIDNKAEMLGVKSSEIKDKLRSGYSFSDIDRICESLQMYQIHMSKLPFKADKNTKMKIKESSEPILMNRRYDDDIDPSLIEMANAFK